MGGALTGGRRVFSNFKSTGAGPSDKPLCVTDLWTFFKTFIGSKRAKLTFSSRTCAPLLTPCSRFLWCAVHRRVVQSCTLDFQRVFLRNMLLFSGLSRESVVFWILSLHITASQPVKVAHRLLNAGYLLPERHFQVQLWSSNRQGARTPVTYFSRRRYEVCRRR